MRRSGINPYCVTFLFGSLVVGLMPPIVWAENLPLKDKAPPKPLVEAEEDVYQYQSANNGSGPMWCRGSTCLVRIGDKVFASGLETIKDAKPLNNCRWMLHQRGLDGWKMIQVDQTGRTREPCPDRKSVV